MKIGNKIQIKYYKDIILVLGRTSYCSWARLLPSTLAIGVGCCFSADGMGGRNPLYAPPVENDIFCDELYSTRKDHRADICTQMGTRAVNKILT